MRAVHRWLFLALGIVAIGFQSLIVQPHFHIRETRPHTSEAAPEILADALGVRLALTDEEHSSDQDGVPAGIDFKDCSLCQSAHQNGHFLKPVTQNISLPPAIKFRAAHFDRQLGAGTSLSFHWQTRAPPLS